MRHHYLNRLLSCQPGPIEPMSLGPHIKCLSLGMDESSSRCKELSDLGYDTLFRCFKDILASIMCICIHTLYQVNFTSLVVHHVSVLTIQG